MTFTPMAKVLADSVAPNGNRLVTVEVTMNRFILSEFNTHRAISKNSASSRAIPYTKMRQRVLDEVVTPLYWGTEQKGMQSGPELTGTAAKSADAHWQWAAWDAVSNADNLVALGVHKSLASRLLEPFLSHTVIASATMDGWESFFALRCDDAAQAEIRIPAEAIRTAIEQSTPLDINVSGWHLPLIDFNKDCEAISKTFSLHAIDEVQAYIDILKKVSAGRCARVSYDAHHKDRDIQADIDLCDRLVASGHMSPLEHVATPAYTGIGTLGNFSGWSQYRHLVGGSNS